MIDLCTVIYRFGQPERLAEIRECFERNVALSQVDRIFVLAEGVSVDEPGYEFLRHPKLTIVPIDRRPTYRDYFELAREECFGVVCIYNSDTYLDESIVLAESVQRDELWCPTRYSVRPDGSLETYYFGSEGVLAFRSPLKPFAGDDVLTGEAGCDARIAQKAKEARIEIKNQSLPAITHRVDRISFRRPHTRGKLIAVLVPVLNRPHRVRPFLENARAASEDVEVYFLAQESDTAEVAAIREAGGNLILTEGISWAHKINRGFEATTEPWIFCGADDLIFRKGWTDVARSVLDSSFSGVIGVHDTIGSADSSTHFLVCRRYIEAFGTVDQTRHVVHEGYRHNCPDVELVETARRRGRFVALRECVVEHAHWVTGKSEKDDTYEKGEASHAADKALLKARHTLIENVSSDALEIRYQALLREPSDIVDHLPTLRALAQHCDRVVEMGTRTAVSTVALLAARPRSLVCYDIKKTTAVDGVLALVPFETAMSFRLESTLDCTIEETDLLFIDTWHVYGQLKAELARHHSKVTRYIALHDTTTFGDRGETAGHRGLWPAVTEFLDAHHEWELFVRYENNNGLTVLRRRVDCVNEQL